MASAQDVANRVPITIGLMLATVMNSLDTTIANVALPRMAGSVSASQDQITWVLTSYIIAAALEQGTASIFNSYTPPSAATLANYTVTGDANWNGNCTTPDYCITL